MKDRQRVNCCVLLGAALSLLAMRVVRADRSESDDSAALPKITVEAKRQATEHIVHAFVSHVPILSNDESFARWNTPICPLVVGLTPDEGEFILTRLSGIAASAGVPMAPRGHCNANFIVVVTSDPVPFLKAWAEREHYTMFGHASMTTLNSFIAKPRTIRVWYNTRSNGAGGSIETRDPPGRQLSRNVVISQNATRIDRNVVYGIASLIIIVDARGMRGYRLGQLADYVAMAGMAEFNFDVDIGAMPTILHLFRIRPGEATPQSLSAWDEAFLKALYHTRQSSRLQTGLIVQSMVRDLVH